MAKNESSNLRKKLSEKHQDVVSGNTCMAASKKRIQTTEQGPYRGTKQYRHHRADSFRVQGR